MRKLIQKFAVTYEYPVHFTQDLFALDNLLLLEIIQNDRFYHPVKMLVLIENAVATAHPLLISQIEQYIQNYPDIMQLPISPIVINGGESIKNDRFYLDQLYGQIIQCGLCRHSAMIVIGGGAVLDAVGYVAATAHRGIPLLRIPTTVLSQCDSGVGVKNSINFNTQKNFLGTFTPPYTVINDLKFLNSLSERDWRAGIAEAIKVALIKDHAFFNFLQESIVAINARDINVMGEIIYRAAELHLVHIGQGGDPFEQGSSRPLDFGHWAAHKLEILSNYSLRHGEAVAIGIALDVTYAYLAGFLNEKIWHAILNLLQQFQLPIYHPALTHNMDEPQDKNSIFQGLQEFREHLGGELTLMMLQDIGRSFNLHTVNYLYYQNAIGLLASMSEVTCS